MDKDPGFATLVAPQARGVLRALGGNESLDFSVIYMT
jgi:hypothetical protein